MSVGSNGNARSSSPAARSTVSTQASISRRSNDSAVSVNLSPTDGSSLFEVPDYDAE
ncbi:hypothetical protein [Saccharopolyspora pogona]|uniref:hypothetical protein n=1 Tax=Saccharopolyspora pogona TaxID=333966 RepID=UPI0016850622|nr:hypothetical protein [Saccharopolyspora pogona]